MSQKEMTKQHLDIHKRTHPKISEALVDFLFVHSMELGGEFYYYLFTKIHLEESDKIPTAGVFFRGITPVMMYNKEFIDSLELDEVKFLLAHEAQHLIWGHNRRGEEHGYDHRLYNIATDMLINKTLMDEYSWMKFIENGVKWDSHYKGEEISDKIYEWLKEKADKLAQMQAQSGQQQGQQSGGNQSGQQPGNSGGSGSEPGDGSSNQSGQGNQKSEDESNSGGQGEGEGEEESEDQGNQAGQRHLEGEVDAETENILDQYNNDEEFTGETTDCHLPDEGNISEELKAEIVKDVLQEMKSRGVIDGHMQRILDDRIRESRNNFLKLLKRSIADIKGKSPQKTFQRLSRRIPGKLKGKKGIANKINVILDASGSMMGPSIDKVCNEIFKDGYEINLVVADTRVSVVHHITNKEQLRGLNLHDCGGGTTMQPAINYLVEKKWQNFGTVLLTDGWTDTLDTSEINNFLILWTGDPCPIAKGKPMQIEIPPDYRNDG
jgi:predicted metal-dependent peptidase